MKTTFTQIGDGNPLVLIHGFPLSSEMWREQAELLAENGFRVILHDLPGFGGNTSIEQRFSLAEMAAQIDETLDSLRIEKAIIGGLSMGGYVLFEFFRRAPEKFSALILCDTTHLADTDEKRASRYDLISKIEAQGAEALFENMLPNLISDQTKQNNPSLAAELREIFLNVNPDSAVNALQSMAERRDSSDLLEQIDAPTLLIFGEFDKVTNLDNARQLNREIKHSELSIINDAGHYANLEQPAQFNRALLDFCRRIEF